MTYVIIGAVFFGSSLVTLFFAGKNRKAARLELNAAEHVSRGASFRVEISREDMARVRSHVLRLFAVTNTFGEICRCCGSPATGIHGEDCPVPDLMRFTQVAREAGPIRVPEPGTEWIALAPKRGFDSSKDWVVLVPWDEAGQGRPTRVTVSE